MFTHDIAYNQSIYFETKEEAFDDYLQYADVNDYCEFMEVNMDEILHKFFHRESDTTFCNFLQEEIEETMQRMKENIIYEINEEDFDE